MSWMGEVVREDMVKRNVHQEEQSAFLQESCIVDKKNKALSWGFQEAQSDEWVSGCVG